MTEQSLPHNRRACADCNHQISTYTLWYTQLDDISLKLAHVWGSFSHKVPWQFFKIFDNVGKVLHADISDGIPCLFVFFRPYFGLDSQSGYQPLSRSPQFSFWLWRCGFHLVHTVKLCWDIQGDNISLPLISLCFLTLRRPQFFMFTDWNKYFLPVNFPSQNVFWVEQPILRLA